MAKEYIEREDAIRKAKMANHDANCGYVDWEQDERTALYINEIPAADVRPVARGRWTKLDMHSGMEQYKCSVCNQECYVPTCMGEPLYSFCPNCGAKMEVQDG